MSSPPRVIRTVIVDDSAFVRKAVREMLASSPLIQVVGVARDGEEALEMVAALKPDVVTCDIQMPLLDGVGFVRQQMARQPVPILLLTSVSQDADPVIEALNAGAVDMVQKPSALATDNLRGIRDQLVEKIITAGSALARRPPTAQPFAPQVSQPVTSPSTPVRAGRPEVIVLGISTGGPQALRYMLPLFPADFPVPIAMVLHMPVGYTALYAEKLNELCKIEVREAKEGDLLRPGLALLAQAGRHLEFRRLLDGTVAAHLTMHPLEKIHRPSADVLFKSAADIFRERTLAVVMTGMGDDGKEGAAWIKGNGGTVITEAEKSCVIYGMPRSVVEAGLSDGAFPLKNMAQAIMERL